MSIYFINFAGMKRVLMITGGLRRNGTEAFMLNAIRNMDPKEVQFDFLVEERTGSDVEQEAMALGAQIHSFIPRKQGWKAHIRSLDAFFKANAHRYDAVHFNGNSFTGIMPLVYARKYGIPVRIAHSHNVSTAGLHNRLLHRLNRARIAGIATHYLGCSEGALDWGFKGTRARKEARVVNNGIDLDSFRFNPETRDRVRRQLCLEKAFTVGSVAAFRKAKNHGFMIDVLRELVKLRPDTVMVFAGDGELKQEIERRVIDEGLAPHALFLGSRSDVSDLMQAFDLLLFPSLYEGFGIVAIEAQAAGLPVVASTAVPRETDLTPLIRYIPLDVPAKEWAQKIAQTELSPRSDIHPALRKHDIKETCRLLMEVYSSGASKPRSDSTT